MRFSCKRTVWLLVFLVADSRLSAFDVKLSGAEAGLWIHPEYNKSFHYSWDIAALGLAEFNGWLVFGGGASVGNSWDIVTADACFWAEALFPFFRKYVPVNLRFQYIFNGLPEYETWVHTLLPLFSITWPRFGFSAGPALRYTAFGEDPVLFEPVLAYSVYANLFNTEDALAGISLGNFSSFAARNLASFSFTVYNRFRITPLVSIASELRIDMSGNTGHLLSVYGISFQEGIVFTWQEN